MEFYGHKPTLGLISTEGVVVLSWTLDHVGVHARSAEDCARLVAGASGAEAELAAEIAKPASLEMLRETPVAALEIDGLGVEPEVAAAYARVLERARAAGLEIEMVRLAGYDFLDRSRLVLVAAAEAGVEHADALLASPAGFSEELNGKLAQGRERSAVDLARAYRELGASAEAVRVEISGFSALLSPATPRAATPIEQGSPVNSHFTALGNVLGLPATVFPAGLTDDGLPIGVQALAWDDETSLGLAKALGQDLGVPPSFRG